MSLHQIPASSQYPPSISDDERSALVQVIKDWSIANGLAVRPPPAVLPSQGDPDGILATGAPVTLFPSSFPAECYNDAKHVQGSYNLLYASISRDEDFIRHIVEE
jgi:glutathione synthase